MELTRDEREFLGIVHDPAKREKLVDLVLSWGAKEKGVQDCEETNKRDKKGNDLGGVKGTSNILFVAQKLHI